MTQTGRSIIRAILIEFLEYLKTVCKVRYPSSSMKGDYVLDFINSLKYGQHGQDITQNFIDLDYKAPVIEITDKHLKKKL